MEKCASFRYAGLTLARHARWQRLGHSGPLIRHISTANLANEWSPAPAHTADPIQPREEISAPSKPPSSNYRKKSYGGKQIWHRWYFTCDRDVHRNFTAVLHLLGKLTGSYDAQLLEIARLLRAGNSARALELWKATVADLQKCRQAFAKSSLQREAKVEELLTSFNSNGWSRLVDELSRLNGQQLSSFWIGASVSQLPIVVELIPLLVARAASHENAMALLNWMCENRIDSKAYAKGLQLGLNALLWRLMVDCSHSDDNAYAVIHSILESFAGRIDFRFIPAVAHGFARVIPYHGMPSIFSALVAGKAHLGSKHIFKFLRATYFTTHEGKSLVLEHAPSGGYSFEMYRYLLKRLAAEKDAERTISMLDTILERAPNRTEVYKSLLLRVIELDDMSVAAGIFDSMLSKGVVPDSRVLMLLFRGFSRHGHEDNYSGVLQMLLQQDIPLNKYICSEILWAVSQTYSPTMVAELYARLISPNHLSELGLDEVLRSPTVASLWDERRPSIDFNFAKNDIDLNSFADIEASLNVTYYSLLRHVTDDRVIRALYEAYKHFVLSRRARPRTFVVDRMVHSLCELSSSPTAVDTAYDIFMDALSNMRFSNGMKGESRLQCAKYLCRSLVGRDLKRAGHLIEAIVKAQLPLRAEHLVPIILQNMKDRRRTDALRWYEYGRSCGLQFENPVFENLKGKPMEFTASTEEA